MPYLEAVTLEGFHIRNVANLSPEREVRADDMQLPSGIYLSPGTYVGINPAAMDRPPYTFGAYPLQFDPMC